MDKSRQYFDVHISDKVVPPRAVAVLPSVLQIRKNFISPKQSLSPNTRFGPLQGVAVNILHTEATELIKVHSKTRLPIFLFGRTDNAVFYMDVTDKDKSNWLGLLPLGDQNTANVWLYEENQQIFGITTKSIASRVPMALGYSKTYAEEHGLQTVVPVLDLDEALNRNYKLDRHPAEKQVVEISSRRRYRCAQCRRTFSRLFTLKRHHLQFCVKETDAPKEFYTQSESKVSAENLSDRRNNQSTIEDNRVPSDESLQNYTNGLDFSTNLFDTDRIPNLDTSGSSRSESEFNNYAAVLKDDVCLSTYLNFGNSPSKVCKEIEIQEKKDEKILVICPQCNETIVKEMYRQHYREKHTLCLKCECGQIFNNRRKLALHIHKEHSKKFNSDTKTSQVATQDMPYKCDECKHGFKRRGMLVNHTWRVHGRLAAAPLARRLRHYPCAVCPKVYGAAAKRDSHVKRHHPGAESMVAAPIEGGEVRCEPAVCPAAGCTRQYATRAKLLQHLRAAHPAMAVPVKPRTKKNVPQKAKKIHVIYETSKTEKK